MESYSLFRIVIYKWIGAVASLAGYDLFHQDRKISAYNRFTLAVGVACPLLYTYAIVTCDGDLRFTAITYFGAGIQLTTKALFPVIHKKSICRAITFLEEIYVANTKSSENKASFDEFTILLTTIIKSLMAAGVAAYCTYITSPAVLYFIDSSHLEPILSWVLPGTTPGSENIRHYIINQSFNVFVTFWSVVYYILFPLLFTFLLVHVALLSNIMSNKLNAIDQMLVDKESPKNDVKKGFKNIILMHMELSSFIADLKTTYYYEIAICIFFTTVFVAVRILGIFLMKNPPLSLYFIAVWEIFELGYMCGVCTVIDVNNDRFFYDLSTFNWYLLPMDCKRPLIILLDAAKTANNFTVLEILPLNMKTYIMLINRIYSFTMVLFNILRH